MQKHRWKAEKAPDTMSECSGGWPCGAGEFPGGGSDPATATFAAKPQKAALRIFRDRRSRRWHCGCEPTRLLSSPYSVQSPSITERLLPSFMWNSRLLGMNYVLNPEAERKSFQVYTQDQASVEVHMLSNKHQHTPICASHSEQLHFRRVQQDMCGRRPRMRS